MKQEFKTLEELKSCGEAPEFLTDTGYDTLTKGYLLPGETPKGMWMRAASSSAKYLKKPELAPKFFDLMWKNWLCLASPVCANMGVERGLPISCFSSFVPDSIIGITDTLQEVALLSKHGGGTSGYWGAVRGRGASISGGGKSDGVVPFNKMYDSTIIGVSQGGVRRGAFASYIDVEHEDIEEFLEMRRPAGDINRQCLNLHHGICISDVWMNKVLAGPGKERELWKKILKTRFETGEPYLFFTDNVNRQNPECYKANNLTVKGSNLCLTGDTLVITKQGHQQIKDLVGKEVEIWDGNEWKITQSFIQTKAKSELLEITLRDGSIIKCTPEHKFILASGEKVSANKLKPKTKLKSHSIKVIGSIYEPAAYLKGFMVGDGTCSGDKPILWLYEPKYSCAERLKNSGIQLESVNKNTNYIEDIDFKPAGSNRMVMTGLTTRKAELISWVSDYKKIFPKEIFNWSPESKFEFIAGVMDSDGSVVNTKHSKCYQIASINYEWLIGFQQLLKTIGVYGTVSLMKNAGVVNFDDGYGEYETQPAYRLTISNISARKLSSLVHFERLVNFPQTTGYNCSPTFSEVKEIKKCDFEAPVYCCNIPSTHQFALSNGLMTGNCNEIMLHTDEDHTFVCCLSSINLARWDEWKDTDAVQLSIWFLDGVMEEFIQKTKEMFGFERAHRFAVKSRALGLGVLGFHTLLQQKMYAFDSLPTYLLNKIIFKHIKEQSDIATAALAAEYGEPEWCKGFNRRNSHCNALAPTVSNSMISGNVSAGIEPIPANAFAQKSAKGTFLFKNKQLEKILDAHGKNTDDVWKSIVVSEGSVQQFDFLTKEEKEVFLTARELNQFSIIKLAAERQKFVDQGQSVNIFFPANVDPEYFNRVHIEAWKQGMKGLYYTRTTSILKGDAGSREYIQQTTGTYKRDAAECTSCQG